MKKLVLATLFLFQFNCLAQSNDILVFQEGKCISGNCSAINSDYVILKRVKSTREEDIKPGVCLKHKTKDNYYRIEKEKEASIWVLSDLEKDTNILRYDDIFKHKKEFQKLLNSSIPISCDMSPNFTDKEYMKRCRNGKKWKRKNFCMSKQQIRKFKLYNN